MCRWTVTPFSICRVQFPKESHNILPYIRLHRNKSKQIDAEEPVLKSVQQLIAAGLRPHVPSGGHGLLLSVQSATNSINWHRGKIFDQGKENKQFSAEYKWDFLVQCIRSGLSVVFRGYLAVATPQLLTVDSGTTTPAIDAITPTGIRRSGGDRFTEQLGRGWWFRVDLVGSRSVCPECMWLQYSGPWGPQFLYDVVSSVRIQTSHVIRLPRVDFDQCQDDCIHWQFDESTENHHVDICSLLWGFRDQIGKTDMDFPTKYGGPPISRKVPKSTSQIYAIWVRQTASAPISSLDATWMEWTRALPNWAIQQLQVIYA